ncbi:DUF1127 domain-containing protein [Actibacterium sp. D379-3]
MTQMTNHMGHARAARGRRSVLSAVSRAFDLSAQRHRLARMDAAQLNDLGLTRVEAEAESRRPFWDVPAGWKC